MKAATITIGRNVGTEPMPDERWLAFYDALTRVAAEFLAGPPWAVASYDGGWDGVPEDAFLVYGPLREDFDAQALYNALKRVREDFEQEAIGLTIGDADLI